MGLPVIDMMGFKKDGWTVTARGRNKYGNGSAFWTLSCDMCGELREQAGIYLRNRAIAPCKQNCSFKTTTKGIDLTGKIYNRLTVLSKNPAPYGWGELLWDCACLCGNRTTVSRNNLLTGNTQSCGCLAGKPKRIVEENNEDLQNIVDVYFSKGTAELTSQLENYVSKIEDKYSFNLNNVKVCTDIVLQSKQDQIEILNNKIKEQEEHAEEVTKKLPTALTRSFKHNFQYAIGLTNGDIITFSHAKFTPEKPEWITLFLGQDNKELSDKFKYFNKKNQVKHLNFKNGLEINIAKIMWCIEAQ